MKPIGRVWKRNNSLSGYVIVGMSCIKFAGSIHEGSNFLFLSKSQRGDSEDEEEVELVDCSTLKEESVTYNGIPC
jgi:hypothetical protein